MKAAHRLNFIIRPTFHCQFLLLAGSQRFPHNDLVLVSSLSKQHSAEDHKGNFKLCSQKVLALYHGVLALLYFCRHIFLFTNNIYHRQCLMVKEHCRLGVTMK